MTASISRQFLKLKGRASDEIRKELSIAKTDYLIVVTGISSHGRDSTQLLKR